MKSFPRLKLDMEVDIDGMLANVEQYFKKLFYTKKIFIY